MVSSRGLGDVYKRQGWGVLLGPMFTAINTNMRQLLDSGTLSITAAKSGLITSGVGTGRGNRQEAGPIV